MAVACKVILAACLLGACAPLGLGESSSCADGVCQGASETPSLLQSKHVMDKTDQEKALEQVAPMSRPTTTGSPSKKRPGSAGKPKTALDQEEAHLGDGEREEGGKPGKNAGSKSRGKKRPGSAGRPAKGNKHSVTALDQEEAHFSDGKREEVDKPGSKPTKGDRDDHAEKGGKPGSEPAKGDGDDHAEKACRDLDWKSSSGITCSAYAHWNYCTMSGGYGTGWSKGWGSFGDSATKGVSADEACCACGGGKQAACTTTDGSGPSSGYPCKCGSSSCTAEKGICSADSSTCMPVPTPAPTPEVLEACWDVGQRVMIKPSSHLFGKTRGSCATVATKLCQGGGYKSYTFDNGASDCCLYYHDLQLCQACALYDANIAHGLTASSPDGHSPDFEGGDADQAVDGNVDTYWRQQNDGPGPHILQLEAPPVFAGYGMSFERGPSSTPTDWVLLCDGIQIHSEANHQAYAGWNNYSTCLGAPYSCSELQLSISSWIGTSPTIVEFELYAGFGPAGCGGYYEAELATTDHVKGPKVASEHAGYSGSGYVEQFYWIDWLVTSCASGFYELKFTYATPDSDRQFKLVINSNTEVASLSFPTTGSWSTWGDVVHNVALLPGSNTIRLEVVTNCGVHVDRLTVTAQESV